MEKKALFDKYRSRLRNEGIVKSLLCGLIAGTAVMFVAAFSSWFASFGEKWIIPLLISLGAGLAVTAIVGVILYFTLFRPTEKKVARRVDELGLDERMITMLELEGDDSYIAKIQREDAQKKLNEVNTKQIKFRIKRAVVVSVAVLACLGVAMTTVTTMSEAGIIVKPWELGQVIGPDVNFKVEYAAINGGNINGEKFQTVKQGEDAEFVIAVPAEGWMFIGWDDGLLDPARTDTNIQSDIKVTAMFQKVDPEAPEEEEKGDFDPDAPSDGGGGEGNNGEGTGDDAGGDWTENGFIVDGKTDYKDVFAQYYEYVTELLASGQEIPADVRAILEKYFNILL